MRELRKTIHQREGERAFPTTLSYHPFLFGSWRDGFVTISPPDEKVLVMARTREEAVDTLKWHYSQTATWTMEDPPNESPT